MKSAEKEGIEIVMKYEKRKEKCPLMSAGQVLATT